MLTGSMLMLFLCCLLVVAFLYGSVGHGGASGYLAIMALFSLSPLFMRPTALMLNTVVSLTATIQFYRAGHFHWKTFWPFALLSIPFAFIGGMYQLDEAWYKRLLGVALLVPVIKFYLPIKKEDEQQLRPVPLAAALVMGAVLGLLSGLLGIGGGILLSPLLILLHYAGQKQAAAISAPFILVNSVAGLLGQMQKGIPWQNEMIYLLLVALCGGFAGSWLGANKFSSRQISYLLGTVLLMAAIKLLLG